MQLLGVLGSVCDLCRYLSLRERGGERMGGEAENASHAYSCLT